MQNSFDVIVIGAGHNGLVCANYLAKAGKKVLLLEAAEMAGGLARQREFHPGFAAPVADYASHFPERLIRELNLESFGLTRTPAQSLSFPHASGAVTVSGDGVLGVDSKDAAAFDRYRELMRAFADALEPAWLKTIPRIGHGGMGAALKFAGIGWPLRRLGKDRFLEFLRVASLPMRDLMDEYFESDALKALLSWDGLAGNRMAPRSPNSAVLMLLYRMAARNSCAVTGLIPALLASAREAGVDVRMGRPVEQVLLEGSEQGQQVTGVRLADGEILHSPTVVSSADPQTTFLRLLGVEHLEIGFTNRIRRLRCQGLVAKLQLALSDRPAFTGLDDHSGRIILADRLDALEFAFDDSKYGQYSEQPVMEVTLPSLSGAATAPEGQHVLNANIMYVPGVLREGWTDAARSDLLERALTLLEQHAPGIRGKVLGSSLLTPADLEAQYGVTGGHWHHTEVALDQMLMMRPTYEAAQYATPVPGLFICGAGSHPGGDLTGAPGHNAAQAVLL